MTQTYFALLESSYRSDGEEILLSWFETRSTHGILTSEAFPKSCEHITIMLTLLVTSKCGTMHCLHCVFLRRFLFDVNETAHVYK